MSKIVTTADFLQRARKVHGDRYNYSKVVYEAAIRDVIIICPEHGEFKQRPTNHYIGHGCHECGGNKPLTLNRFIERAKKIHKGLYDYSRVCFKNVESKIEIICPDHGPFFQRLMTHLKGFGCNRCGWGDAAKKRSHSTERFIEDSRRVHGDRYDYSRTEYVNAHIDVLIICPDHGSFTQKPAHHTRDVGCPKCSFESSADQRRRTTQDFVIEAKEVHGDKYDYSRVEYKTSHEKVEIGCATHGSFWQSPANHVRGNKAGCPGCAVSGFDQTKPGLLYYIAVTAHDGGTLYKIGITNLSIKDRFSTIDLARIRTVKTWQFEVGRVAAEHEVEVLSKFSRDRYIGPDVLESAGNTELFVRDVLGLDHEHGKSVFDLDALLISRPTQLCFDFSQKQ